MDASLRCTTEPLGTDVPAVASVLEVQSKWYSAPVESVSIAQNDCAGTEAVEYNGGFRQQIGVLSTESGSSTPADFKASQGDDDWHEDPVICPNS